jgi:hypothetical protein
MTVQSEDGWSDELRATHLALSVEDLKFREAARHDPSLLQRSTFRVLDDDPRLYYRQQPWPTFIGTAKLEHLKRMSLAVTALLRKVPQRIFQNDPAKVCEFYGLPSAAVAAIILSEPNCIEESMARGDLIETTGGFKCIEFNFTPNVGGWETSLLAEHFQAIPEITRFIEREGIRLSHTSTLRVLFTQMLRMAERSRIPENGELNVACIFDPDRLQVRGLPETIVAFQKEFDQACRDLSRALRGKVVACPYDQIIAAQGKLFHGKMPIHVILELGLEQMPVAVYRTFKAGKILLFNGPVSGVLSDKRNLALLSATEDGATGAFNPQEREVIARHIPWSRLVAAKKVRFRGEEVFLPDLLTTAREKMVLKEGSNYGGKGVFLGEVTPEARWEELSRTALEKGGWIVQEKLESLPYLYQCGDSGCAPHDVIWGPFVVGNVYGGVILRMQPKAAGGAVNLSLAATEGVVLEVV